VQPVSLITRLRGPVTLCVCNAFREECEQKKRVSAKRVREVRKFQLTNWIWKTLTHRPKSKNSTSLYTLTCHCIKQSLRGLL